MNDNGFFNARNQFMVFRMKRMHVRCTKTDTDDDDDENDDDEEENNKNNQRTRTLHRNMPFHTIIWNCELNRGAFNWNNSESIHPAYVCLIHQSASAILRCYDLWIFAAQHMSLLEAMYISICVCACSC